MLLTMQITQTKKKQIIIPYMGREHEHNSYYFISCLGNKKYQKKLQIHKMCISLNKYFILFNSRSVCYGIKFKFSQK